MCVCVCVCVCVCTGKLAVMLCMDSYLELVNDYEVKERNIVEQFNKDLHEHRYLAPPTDTWLHPPTKCATPPPSQGHIACLSGETGVLCRGFWRSPLEEE